MLFEDAPRFQGLPEDGFELFSLPSRLERRRAILSKIHPALEALGEDLVEALSRRAAAPLHAHLPRLDWPRDYQPFCTWLALSREGHGYQAGAQLNVGVHADHVAVRLGWDTGADGFGRFEFLCRHGELRESLPELAASSGLVFRVYAAAPWPEGSTCVFASPDALAQSFDEVRRRGVWWELGRRYELPASRELVCSGRFGGEARRVLEALLPVYDRLAGDSTGKA
jgi:hypothetical protein